MTRVQEQMEQELVELTASLFEVGQHSPRLCQELVELTASLFEVGQHSPRLCQELVELTASLFEVGQCGPQLSVSERESFNSMLVLTRWCHTQS